MNFDGVPVAGELAPRLRDFSFRALTVLLVRHILRRRQVCLRGVAQFGSAHGSGP